MADDFKDAANAGHAANKLSYALAAAINEFEEATGLTIRNVHSFVLIKQKPGVMHLPIADSVANRVQITFRGEQL
jgi:8-oxo-dGTP pyrophosphatase MutT (NUDIX family)